MTHPYLDWAIIGAVTYAYGLFSKRLKRTPISGALVFLITGFVLGPSLLGWLQIDVTAEKLRTTAELTLALILFTDAARANLPVLRNSARLAMRLLVLGLPLTILLGFAAARWILPDLSLVEAAILAVVLAPTDAALGQAVVTHPLVPVVIREDLSVESGLNDGICVPVLLALLAIAERGDSLPIGGVAGLALLARLFFAQLGLGVLVGGVAALVGSCGSDFCRRRDWIDPDWLPLLAIALPFTAFSLAQQVGGSGFIAAFVAGLVYGGLSQAHKKEELVAAESAGAVLSLMTWVAFGCAVVPLALAQFSGMALLYGLLSLTLVRMLPVALVSSGLVPAPWSPLFVGWFGPRGLASIVFAVMVVDADLPHGRMIAMTVATTVMLSIVAHGLSAVSLVKRYGHWMAARSVRAGEGSGAIP